MYRFLDRPLSEIDAGGQLLVKAMRGWVMAVAERKCPADAITPMFLDKRLVGAIGPFHRALMAMAVHAKLQLGFARACCPCVAEGEALMLAMLSNRQDRDANASRLVGEVHAPALVQSLAELDAALAVAGLSAGLAAGAPDNR
ncbi:hypothetical protein [Croceicoccus mobilis]|uniref:Uncharacterized protein n=1 Tax=Croceicoccus mobilis TaxID=1703339 RepID=A0A916YVL3_9SPHN|nr:hypothetical protein [Croceicoccus mobilis]GGD63130.1 hypothetical protein GCM10010990_10750 [Croceicoccus mobilis]